VFHCRTVLFQYTHVLVSHQYNVGEYSSIKEANKFFENMVKFKYLGTALVNQNYMREEIKIIVCLGNACYQSVLTSAE
jgi:hypothetical protein